MAASGGLLLFPVFLSICFAQYNYNGQPPTQYSPYGQQQAQQPWNPNQPQTPTANQAYGVGGSSYSASTFSKPRSGTPMRFCTVGSEEDQMCQKMIYDIGQAGIKSGIVRPVRQTKTRFYYECVRALDKMECFKWISDAINPLAELVSVTPGEAYIAAQAPYNLVLLVQELLGKERLSAEDHVVAVVRTDRGIDSVSMLRGKRACFGAVNDPITWDLVASSLRGQSAISTPRCDQNYMDSMMSYFGEICAPYDQRNYTQAENDRYRRMCSLCSGQNCPPLNSINRDFPINCLTQTSNADVAFISASALREALIRNTFPEPAMYQVLCPQSADGRPISLLSSEQQSRSIEEWTDCYLGRVPSNAYMTRSSPPVPHDEMAEKLTDIFNSFGGGIMQIGTSQTQRPQWIDSFLTGRYNDGQRVTKYEKFSSQLGQQAIENYLGGYKPYLEDPTVCSQQERARWCTTSKLEQEKCEMMKKAFKTYRLRPDLQCEAPSKNAYVCIDKVHRNQSDITMIDIGDLVVANGYFSGIQIAQERYTMSDLSSGTFYSGSSGGAQFALDEPFSVAVVKDAGINSLRDLRNKRACFTGLYEAHGFMLPMLQLRDAGLTDGGNCHMIRKAVNYFGDSCLPGMTDSEINLSNKDKEKMCKQCEGGERGCGRTVDSRYAGPLGALKCLNDGKGDVAFVPHTALSEISQDQRTQYGLICGADGQRQSIDSYQSCNLGKAPGSVLITNRYKTAQEKRRLADLVLGASRLFSVDLANSQNLRSFMMTQLQTDRSRKTYNMFGKRNRTDVGYTGGGYSSSGSGYGSSSSSFGSDQAVYSLFGVSAYDLRGFGDVNMTFIGDALQSYRQQAEITDWRYCYYNGSDRRVAGLSAFITIVVGYLFRVILA